MIDTDDIMLNTIRTLKGEVEVYKRMTRDSGTGHIFTTINFLEDRIKELTNELSSLIFLSLEIGDPYVIIDVLIFSNQFSNSVGFVEYPFSLYFLNEF